ncbi:hypothetical protein BN946_scf184757.g12 [Trametes cinnabarina]|uniref:RNase H type-1 domain-containing protein n=1 Tax=Pycnoporus cinnabarinus TaxID=5643 RepID=A0A060SKL4_PYCCI|nr:hypothetical protein BN946_scf184757.g12 [Trametes cinnabarina]
MYVDASSDTVVHAAARAMRNLGDWDDEDEGVQQAIWLGDFNRHHQRWDDPGNTHLFTVSNVRKAEVLTRYLDIFGMEMALPAGVPTLEHMRTKNLTRPDNVFCTKGLRDHLRSCLVRPDLRPLRTDHYPIHTEFGLQVAAAPPRPRRDFRQVDWVDFERSLAERVAARGFPPVIESIPDFDRTLDALMQDLQDTIVQHVPLTPATPYTKRWWSKELTAMRKEKERLARESHRHRADKAHPVHAEYRRLRNRYTDAIRAAKKDHWQAWIDSVDGKTIWDANRFLRRGPTDGGSARIPPIKALDDNGRPCILNSNADKGAEFHKTFFLPPSAAGVPEGPFPKPRFSFRPITDEQVRQAIRSLRAFKAPGPDAIPNEVYKHCVDTVAPILASLFRATFTLSYYPDAWKLSATVVLQKPGKSDYTVTKSWRPIALLNCISKILSRAHAVRRKGGAHNHGLPAPCHQDGQGCVAAGARRLHPLPRHQVGLPAADPERLYYNLRMRGVPTEYVDWLRVKLTGRRTRLLFDDYVSAPFDIASGIDQGCPLSVILYAFYNSDLIDSADTADGELAVGSMDDVALVVTGKTFDSCHEKARHFLDRDGGALAWSASHNSTFSLDKFGLLNCKAQPRRIGLGPPLTLSDGTVIPPAGHHRFLGVLVDQGLRFREHVAAAYAKGSTWTALLRRLANTRYGLSLAAVRRLYLSVALPSFLYAADVFLTPVRKLRGHSRKHGSVGNIRRLAMIQRQALLIMTGALRSAPTDALEAHANLLPFDLLVDKQCHRAAVRLCALPDSHPLAPHVRRAGKCLVRSHRSSVHEILDAYRSHLDYRHTERIRPARLSPRWRPRHRTHVLDDREAAADDDPNWAKDGMWRLYTDGSACDGGVGAAAILYPPGRARPRHLYLHLGPDTRHTVYEAELAGVLLGMELIHRERRCNSAVSIALDNRAAIQASTLRSSAPGRYLTDLFHEQLNAILASRPQLRLTLRWVPGHCGVPGNEAADAAAKEAAGGRSSTSAELPRALRKPLPLSVSKARQNFKAHLNAKAAERWRTSVRGMRVAEIDPSLPSKKFDELLVSLPRRHANLLLQLRLGHVPLQTYFARISKAASATCPTCHEEPETVSHYLLRCPTYSLHRAVHFLPLGFSGRNLRTLLNTDEALRPLFAFINATGRLRRVFGELADIPELGDGSD